ncbi:hypothetical protein F5884DRAFT_851059 [Xylogone sp. PMI_703]|nr:hypothetical protein F5884DRAFT_851059 [Xylogone sp. PMI_703]
MAGQGNLSGSVDFGAKYINTNIASNAAQYDYESFHRFIVELDSSDSGQLKSFDLAILSAILCGLGSNTSVQDAYNLAWKVAHVRKGKAGSEPLETYSLERQPVGAYVTHRAMQVLKYHKAIWEALGMTTADISGFQDRIRVLEAASENGQRARLELREAAENTCYELSGIGIELNQRYKSSSICLEDEGEAPLMEELLLRYYKSTYPGCRLPHAWLNTGVPGEPVSTINLAGKGCFTLFTGIGGDQGKAAVKAVSAKLNIELKSFSIGFGQEYEDPTINGKIIEE